MHSSYEVTSLFQPQPRVRRGVSAYALSMTLHIGGIAFGVWALIHNPVIRQRPLSTRYSVRELKMHMPEQASSRNDRLYPHTVRPDTPAAAASPSGPAPQPAHASDAAKEAASADAPPLPNLSHDGGAGKQILLQPKLHVHQQLAEKIPVPMIVMWMPELSPTKLIIPAHPSQPTVSLVPPSLAEPNEELEMSDLSVTASDLQPKTPALLPGTTSPIEVKGPADVKMAPTTESSTSDQATPTAVLSISKVRMPDGVAVLPPDNETLTGAGKDGAGAPQSGNGTTAGGPAGGKDLSNGTGSGGANASGAGLASSGTSMQASGSQTVDHIELPPDGKFGVVVVGASPSDEYPEIAQIWSDRVAYTVYLHVGLPKTWILQYGLMSNAQADGTGQVARLDAPWPYDIFRPNLLAKDVDADALMVHGVLNASGKLQSLAVAFPEGYPHASFVVNALERWQFRPASENGKPTAVEILLIIPEEDD